VLFAGAAEPESYWFDRQADVVVNASSRSFTIFAVHPDCIFSISSMDRGQQHGTVSTPPPNTPFPSPYSENFQGYSPDSMPHYFSDQAGSWSVLPRRDGVNATAFEQGVVAAPIQWAQNSLYPLTLISDWNTSDVAVSVDAFIYSEAAYIPNGNPTTSLQPCDITAASQRWYFNASSSFALPGSLVDGELDQCFAVDGCNPAVGTAVWMWPCVNTPQQNCDSKNQLWTLNASNGDLISGMSTGYCAVGVQQADGTFEMVMQVCRLYFLR
jgi:hypothetical protein